MKNFTIFIITIILLFVSNISAQEMMEHHSHQNHFAMFVGNTQSIDPSSNELTIGADYVRNLSEWFGIGIFGEAILADYTEWVTGITLNFNVIDNLGLRIGPGLEFTREFKEIETPGSLPVTESHQEFLYRAGLYYSFHLGDLSITPSIDFDLVKDYKFLVYGLNFGTSF